MYAIRSYYVIHCETGIGIVGFECTTDRDNKIGFMNLFQISTVKCFTDDRRIGCQEVFKYACFFVYETVTAFLFELLQDQSLFVRNRRRKRDRIGFFESSYGSVEGSNIFGRSAIFSYNFV